MTVVVLQCLPGVSFGERGEHLCCSFNGSYKGMRSAVVWGILYVRAAELLAKAVVPGRGLDVSL